MPIPAIGAALSRALPAASNLLSKAPGLQGIGSLLGGGSGGGDQAQGAQQSGPAGAASAIIQRLKAMVPGGQD